MLYFVASPFVHESSPDVGAQPEDLADLYQRLKVRTLADVPPVGHGEVLELLLGVTSEPALHVVRLNEVPFARPNGDMVPVAEQYTTVANTEQVVGVGVSVDESRS
ncbi:hypothetical protein BJF79_33655 [Actinomadura sp. CNU-125]|nr:hypothetical protein BJF79_33655 [Actinomadura sp. CNU-125]